MARYTFHLMLASVSITDSPVGYQPPRGPEVRFRVTYNQREDNQPVNFSYSNLGQRWVHNWMSYVEDDPGAVGERVDLRPRGGGLETFDEFVDGVSSPEQDDRSTMMIESPDPITYRRELQDGSVEVFAQPDGLSTVPRRVFLTEWKDAQGNGLTFTYDTHEGRLRLVAVTDALGQVTTLHYDSALDPLKITSVVDPFQRTASLEYDEAGQLVRITDVIGLQSEFEYGTGTFSDFIKSMTTPYGTTTFRTGDHPSDPQNSRWVEAVDPLGGRERVELLFHLPPSLPHSDDEALVPPGFANDNNNLHNHLAVYYDKLVMSRQMTDPPDIATGEITRWRFSANLYVSGYQLQNTKLPLERRVWYEQYPIDTFPGWEAEPGQPGAAPNLVGPEGRPTKIGVVLEDGTSQIHRYEYNSRGQVTHYTDPAGRETFYEYDVNEIDVFTVKQRNPESPTGYDLLSRYTYDSRHLPLTTTDASGQTTNYTYTADGQLETMTTPVRAGITEHRTTTYEYDPNGDYLQSVTGPAPAATTSYSYDAYGRVRTVTDSDAYVLTFDYDDFDRQVKVTYPDGTYEETVYDRLDPVWSRDRLGRWTRRVYDATRRLTATTDPLGRTVIQQWCACGSMDALIDANGNRTRWERDIQGRVEKEIRANDSEWVYAYDATGRLESVTDPLNQGKNYGYDINDNLTNVTYTNTVHPTPNVSFTYDGVHNRVTSMSDGTGATSYTYYDIEAPPSLGAGRLQTVDGPMANDTITYGYDELGRIMSRDIDGVGLTYEYDFLGRIVTETNALGTFSYQYDGVTSRLSTVTYPNGQTTSYAYFPNSGDHRLEEIHHRLPAGATLSKFNYIYDAVGNITTWVQQQDSDPATAEAYDFGYDAADQLRSAVWRTTGAVPNVLKRYGYAYDPAGNRTVEQIDDAPVLSAYDDMNRLTNQTPGGAIRFAGTLNEAATLTIQGLPATVTNDNRFEGTASVGAGSNQITVTATDYSGNQSPPYVYDVSLAGSPKTYTFDANGNMTGDGTRTFEWDAENRLLAVNQGTERSEFSYDGISRRVAIIEKSGENVLSSLHYVWCHVELCEERALSGSVLASFFTLGQRSGQDSFFYTGEHLRSVREVVDGSGVLQSRYEYELYGERTSIEASVDTKIGFSGHYFHQQTGLILAPLRAYAPELGNWLSEDPAGGAHDSRYSYVTNNPIRYSDPLGLWKIEETLQWNPVTNPDMTGPCGLRPNDPRPGGGCAPLSSLRSWVTANCEEDCQGSWRAKDITLHFKLSLFLYAGDPSQFPAARDSGIRNSYDAGWQAGTK